MASALLKPKPVGSTAPDWYEKLLAAVAAVLLVIVLVAVTKGEPTWWKVRTVVWWHLSTILVALALTPYMMLQPRGTEVHRLLGRIWIVAMIATAAVSLLIRHSNTSYFSFIHILSVFVLIMAPRAWILARRHNVAGHRSAIRGLVTGALVIAGYFTLLQNRLLGGWLFG